MRDRNATDEGFVNRWSRRKSRRQADGVTGQSGEAPAPAQAQQTPAIAPDAGAGDFANVDFGALDFSSDYARFMRSGVPGVVRNQALKRLWSSSDIIGRPDDLDDYLEDFSEQAMAIPAELAKSAYQIGRGFVTAEDDPAPAQDPPSGATVESGHQERVQAVSPDPVTEPADRPETARSPTEQPQEAEATLANTDPRAPPSI